MLHLNDDHNDELFRRAAESYPLKTDSSDWDAIRSKMDTTPDNEAVPVAVAKRKQYRFLWLLLLLIPLLLFESRYAFIRQYLGHDNNENKIKVIPVVNSKEKSDGDEYQTALSAQQEAAVKSTDQTQLSATGQEKTSNSTIKNNLNNGVSGGDIDPIKQETVSNQNTVSAADGSGNNKANKKQPSSFTGTRKKMTLQPALPASDETNISPASRKKITSKTRARKKLHIESPQATEEDSPIATLLPEKLLPVTEPVIPEYPTPGKNDDADVKNEKPVAVTVTSASGAANKTNDNKIVQKGEKKDKASRKKFYAGLVAGPDLSTIKWQTVKKAGLNYGILLGYQINDRFSVEASLLKDKKLYSTAGKYFNIKNYSLPPNAYIGEVTGECKMLELPLNITYRFGQKTMSAWFVSAGSSSYFMKSENYTYDIIYAGINYPYASAFKNKSTSLFAMVNFSVGYTYKCGKQGSLRMEPFVKLPTKKIGTGNLPIQSGGIFIGYTRNLF
jgi:hypothetical protein